MSSSSCIWGDEENNPKMIQGFVFSESHFSNGEQVWRIQKLSDYKKFCAKLGQYLDQYSIILYLHYFMAVARSTVPYS